MIYFALFAHVLLVIGNYQLSRSWLYPPTIFSCLWSFMFLSLIVIGDFFYPISDFTLLIFMVGSLAFTAGGIFSLQFKFHPRQPDNWSHKKIHKFLDLAIVMLIVMLPLYVKKLQALSALSGVDDFWMGIRFQTSSGSREEVSFGAFAYLLSFANFSSMAALFESLRSSYSKRKTLLLLTLTFAYGVATAARSGTITLLLSLLGVAMISGKFNFRAALIGAVSFLLLFSVPAILLGKGGDRDASLVDNITSLLDNLKIYAFSGMVAFDQTVQSPGMIESNDSTFLFFFALGRGLGKLFGYDIPVNSMVMEYTTTPWLTNVYSVYFPYYSDFGLGGVIALMFFVGAVLTVFYRLAALGNPAFVILYGLSFASLMVTSFVETFLTTLSYWLQAAIFAFALYNMPMLSFSRRVCRFK